MIPSFEPSGLLPRGRFVCRLEEAKQELVLAPRFKTSKTRADIWEDFCFMIEFLKKRASVPAVFLGGSFVTAKLDPADIDLTVIIDKDSVRHVGTWDVINKALAAAQSRRPVGGRTLRVDPYLIPWDCQPSQQLADRDYLELRGRWDDWWQRSVRGEERQTPERSHAFPVAGYLEVIVDGYQ